MTLNKLFLALILGSVSFKALEAQQAKRPAPPPMFSESLLASNTSAESAAGYAAMFGVSVDEARSRLGLQEKASRYATTLVAANSEGFVDLAIRHQPNFRIVLYYNKAIDQAQLTRAAPVELRRFLVFRPVKRNQSQLAADRNAISASLRANSLRYGVEYDLEQDRFVVEYPAGADIAKYRAAVPAALKDDVDLREGLMAQEVAALYGGTWFEAGGLCTAGWPIRDSGGKEGLLTAGHCGPPNQMYFSWNGGALLSPPFVISNTDNGWQTLDYAQYRLGTAHTTGRLIYVQNNATYNGYTNTVPGIVSAFYEITTPQSPTTGAYICKNGATTGVTCGIIVDRNWSGDGKLNLVKVSQSAQPYIAEGGDSGGPVFGWSTDKSMVRPMGITISTARYADGTPCRNTSTTASNNTTCYFVFMPLTTIRGYAPFTVNTVNGFVAP